VVAGKLELPVLVGIGASRVDPSELETLRQTNQSLRLENESYRVATGELADQISSLQSALVQLGDQPEIDPAARAALAKLPAVIRSRAAGGGAGMAAPVDPAGRDESTASTVGVLKNLLDVLEARVASVKTRMETQQAMARATPTIWPIAGWLSSRFGRRADPFTGAPDFHSGLDIAAERGTPVRATADGTIETAGFNGNYGRAILLDHGYGISTRYGHLSKVAVSAGQSVHRGDVIGYVGSTGRATSPHLHYEILFNGRPFNPLNLLARP
jgi:murein DD-endopeptidase MepM/ murein hydrolase activator NlpD